MNSANARDCLLHLARAKLSEREDLVQLNDKFVDIIEHVHYMEAEHTALEHDYNLLKSGVQSDSSGINEIFEVEIRNVRVGIEEVNRNRQQLLSEQSHLTQQVKEAEQQWRHASKAALGVPKEVDEDFARICQIKYEDCLTKRRIKYMEDKNRLIKQNNGRIFEQINLMRMRKDQAVSLHHEYVMRKNDLLSSIRNLEEDNKKVIMNEHKYFTRDRNADRHVFRDQLRQAIADIRADYEFKRLKNEEEIKIRLDREITRLNSNPTINITWDKLRDELSIVKTNCHGLQQQVTQVEIRNATLTQQIELLRLEISDNNHSFEISLDSKIKEIEKMREQCTSIVVELEKLCDLKIDLDKEIAVYRRLLDQSGSVTAHTASTQVISRALNQQNHQFMSERNSIRTTSTTDSHIERSGHVVRPPQYIPPPPLPEVQPIHENYQSTYVSTHDASPIRPTYTPYHEQSSSSHSRSSVIENYTHQPVPLPTVPVAPISVSPLPIARTPIPIPAPPTIPLPPTPTPITPIPSHQAVENVRSSHYQTSYTSSRAESPLRTQSPAIGQGLRRAYEYDTVATAYGNVPSGTGLYDRIGSTHTTHSHHGIDTGVDIRASGGIGSGVQTSSSEHRVVSNFPPLPSISDTINNRRYDTVYQSGVRTNGYQASRHAGSHSVSSSHYDTINIDHSSPSPIVRKPEAVRAFQDGRIEESSSFDSVDEDNFQRFTRWYKGRVKISDVTPDFVQLVNRSSKTSADIGGFKLIHEFGNKSVYVVLPAGLILRPKDSLKIYARNATHEHGAVVAEIDLFDTTIHTNTSIRNTNNEVKSWFVYTSNTEIGDSDHHHH